MAGSNANAANYPDGQAVWESVQSLNAVSSGHCNMVYHAAGWLEAGLTASFEKVIMDCEVIQQQIYLNQPLDASEDALAFEAMKEVGPEAISLLPIIPSVVSRMRFTAPSFRTGVI